MDFNPKQRLAITKSIIELTDPSGNYGLVKRRLRKNDRFDDGAIMFYDNERHNLSSSHNRPLFVIACVNEVKFKRVMLDRGFSLNIISLSVVDVLGIPKERITR